MSQNHARDRIQGNSMIKCPECSHEFKNPEKVEAGKKTKGRKRNDLKKGGSTWMRINRPDCRINPDSTLVCTLGVKGCYVNHKNRG